MDADILTDQINKQQLEAEPAGPMRSSARALVESMVPPGWKWLPLESFTGPSEIVIIRT